MAVLNVILPIVVLAAIWFLISRGLRMFRRPKKESLADYAKTHSVDEVLKKYGTVPQPPAGPAQTAASPKRPPLPITSRWVLGPEFHERDAPESRPFGEDIDSPDSREIPVAFRGVWEWEHAARSGRKNTVTIEAERYQTSDHLGMQPVVAVRVISDSEIAVVSQAAENGRWSYSLQYLGLLEGGRVLTDLESMDMKWHRAKIDDFERSLSLGR